MLNFQKCCQLVEIVDSIKKLSNVEDFCFLRLSYQPTLNYNTDKKHPACDLTPR